MSALCAHHAEHFMAATDHRATDMPALVQIGGQSNASALRQALDCRKARFKGWRATVRHYQALAVSACARGINCTVTEPYQPALFEVAA